MLTAYKEFGATPLAILRLLHYFDGIELGDTCLDR